MCDLSAPQFKDENRAREYLEALRWPNGAVCPHCGNVGGWPITGKSARPGLYKCASYPCRKQFTVTVGTVFERSKIPLTKWLMAVHLMCASKKGMSSHQLHRMLGVTYKTAWFLSHRIREAMREEPNGLLGSGGGTNHVSEILDWKYEDLGTVEGTLEVVSAHNGYEIRLYEPVWLQPVRCTFDEDLLEDALRNFKRRVEVSGMIRYTKDGMPVSAKVLKIEPMPDPSQLPSWREVKGILRN